MPDALHRSPECPGRLTGAGAYQAPRGKDFPPHQHPVWELVYYRTGSIRCPLGPDIYQVSAGTLLLTPPHTPHAEVALTAYSNFYLTLEAPPDQPWPRICYDDEPQSLGSLCRALLEECQGRSADREAMLGALLCQLDIRLRRLHETRHVSPAEQVVRRAEALIGEHFAAPLSIAELSRDLGVSPSTLRAAFAHRRGRSPLACLHAVRLRHALALLHNSTLPLETVAEMCGYYSASHLSRYVQQETGKSPGAVRRG